MFLSDYYKEELVIQMNEISKIKLRKVKNYDVKNCKIISLFAEKGGVGKTTNAITLAYTFAENGHRVLLYDCDSQRSLSASVLGLRISANPDKFVDEEGFDPLTQIINDENIDENKYFRTLYDQMIPNNNEIKPAHAILIRKNIWLVPGNRNMSDLDQVISNEELMSDPSFTFAHHVNSKTGKPYAAIIKTAEEYQIDYVFLDLNPNKGPLNRCLTMASNYIIIPAIADYHSAEMMNNMKANLENWCIKTNKIKDVFEIRDRTSPFMLPYYNPKFLGFILNRIDSNRIGFISNGLENNSFRKMERCWIDRVQACANKLSQLQNFVDGNRPYQPLAISTQTYINCHRFNKIGVVREYWGLKNISDIVHIPVPFLKERHMIQYHNTDDKENNDYEEINNIKQTEQDDVLLTYLDKSKKENKLKSISKFKLVFQEIYQTIIQIIRNDIQNN